MQSLPQRGSLLPRLSAVAPEADVRPAERAGRVEGAVAETADATADAAIVATAVARHARRRAHPCAMKVEVTGIVPGV